MRRPGMRAILGPRNFSEIALGAILAVVGGKSAPGLGGRESLCSEGRSASPNNQSSDPVGSLNGSAKSPPAAGEMRAGISRERENEARVLRVVTRL